MVTHKSHKHLSPTNNVDSTVDNVRRVKNMIEMAKHFWLFCYCNQHFVKAKTMCTQILYSYYIYIYMYMCIHSYANLLISQGFTQNVTAICYSCIIILVNCFIKDKNFRRDVFIDITKSLVNNNLCNFWQFKVFIRTSSFGAIIRGRGLLKRKIKKK